MAARRRTPSLFPEDERRMVELEQRVEQRMVSVDDAMRAAAAFNEFVDNQDINRLGLALVPMDDEDSLVVRIDSIVRTVA